MLHKSKSCDVNHRIRNQPLWPNHHNHRVVLANQNKNKNDNYNNNNNIYIYNMAVCQNLVPLVNIKNSW